MNISQLGAQLGFIVIGYWIKGIKWKLLVIRYQLLVEGKKLELLVTRYRLLV